MATESNTPLLDLFSDESKWCQGFWATDHAGRPSGIKENEAYCFCLHAGVLRVYQERQHSNVLGKLKRIIKRLFPKMAVDDFSVITFNDTHSFADIRRVVEAAGV